MRFHAGRGARPNDNRSFEYSDVETGNNAALSDALRVPNISRRAFVGGSLAIGATVALPRRAWAATATVPLANFYSSIGVNAHSWYNNSLWPQRLLDLGILNIRGKVGQSTSVVQKLQTFF